MLTNSRHGLHLFILIVIICLVQAAPVSLVNYGKGVHITKRQDDTIHLRERESTIFRRNKWLPTFRKLQQSVKGSKGPHVFWSGTTDSKTIKPHAENHATRVGGTTIHMNINAAGISTPKGETPEVKRKWWRLASKIKAQNAKGVAHAVLGEQVRKDSVFNTVELPHLKKNAEVPKVVQVDPKTGKPIKQFKP